MDLTVFIHHLGSLQVRLRLNGTNSGDDGVTELTYMPKLCALDTHPFRRISQL